MVLTFCKELAMAMLSSGRGISNVIDCTVRLLEDSVADFVIKNGGWVGTVLGKYISLLQLSYANDREQNLYLALQNKKTEKSYTLYI